MGGWVDGGAVLGQKRDAGLLHGAFPRADADGNEGGGEANVEISGKLQAPLPLAAVAAAGSAEEGYEEGSVCKESQDCTLVICVVLLYMCGEFC